MTHRHTHAKKKSKSIIPGFGLSFGIVMAILGIIVVIPLCSLVVFSARLSLSEFWQTITRPGVLSSYAVSLSTAVAGIALTHLTVQNGWVGRIFARFGIDIAYTRIGITIALVFIGIPFVVRSVQPVLEKVDREYEEAAAMFGASRIQIFFRVILPEILPALIAGFTMAFARSLGEYGSVVFIAGNTPYETEITPLLIMSELQEYDYASETSIALVMLAIAFVILLVNAFIQSRTSRIVSGID